MFTLTQAIDAPPTEVSRAFTEPEPFAAWFVADGFTTPSDRVSIDARTDGQISAVFVGAGDVEVPFTVRFGEFDLPRGVVLRFDEPAEEITIKFEDLGDGRTRLDYRSEGLPADHEPVTKSGVAHMLGEMASYFTR
ncbi:SRPBCC domain-containing protein [Kribbella sp. NPDC051952]|uniref:SRPBCC family protein n=1 Tax=Kribbella sp. NPDC051952 TaxID=3154851 RepID=UPI00342C63A7